MDRVLPTTLTEEEQRQAVVKEALEWEFTPHRHRGQVKGLQGGADCGSFIFSVFKRAGIIEGELPPNYSPQWWAHRENQMYTDEVSKYWQEMPDVPERTPKPGDIILYHYGRTFGHGAIVLDYPQGIHLHPKQGMVTKDGRLDTSPSFIGRERKVFAIKGWT